LQALFSQTTKIKFDCKMVVVAKTLAMAQFKIALDKKSNPHRYQGDQ